jgi:hypothetical protein
MRKLLLTISTICAMVFGTALLATWTSPISVERAAREIVRIEVEKRVGEKIDALSNSKAIGLAAKLLGKTDAELAAAKRDLNIGLSEGVRKVIDDMLESDCPCRVRLAQFVRDYQKERVAILTEEHDRLAGMIERAYASVSDKLIREFRIVTASNAAAFALLFLVTYYRRRAALQLALPAVVLVSAVLITSALYLFNQNWLHTVIYAEYMGLGYAAYLAAVSALLADVVFNRARLTTIMFNIVTSVLGGAIAVAC